MEKFDVTTIGDLETKVKEIEKKQIKYQMLACKNCGDTKSPLIKATDSYYCISCFNRLRKQRFVKEGKKKHAK